MPEVARLRQNLLYDMTVHVGEAEVASFVFKDEFFVLDAKEVEGGGVEVVNVERINRCGEAEGIGFAVGDSAFNSSPGEEHRAGLGVVIAAAAL